MPKIFSFRSSHRVFSIYYSYIFMVEWLVRNFSINSSKKTNEFPHLLKGFLLKKLS